jgi:hypothetical protein
MLTSLSCCSAHHLQWQQARRGERGKRIAMEKKPVEANDNDARQNRRNGGSHSYLEAQATINNQQYIILTL